MALWGNNDNVGSGGTVSLDYSTLVVTGSGTTFGNVGAAKTGDVIRFGTAFNTHLGGTHIAPTRIEGHDHGIGQFFHNRIIDRVTATRGKCLGLRTDEIRINAGAAPRQLASCSNIRRMLVESLKITRRHKQEHAAVPIGSPRSDQLLRYPSLRFFHEAANGKSLLLGLCDTNHTHRIAAHDVAVTGLGPLRHDPERHEAPRFSQRSRQFHGATKGRFVGNHVISGQHEQQWVDGRITRQRHLGSERDRGRGVTTDGLKDNLGRPGIRRRAEQTQLLGNQKPMSFVADDDRWFKSTDITRPQQCRLQHGLASAREGK